MTGKPLRIGTRDSILATWQARFVQERLKRAGTPSELIFIKTEGDRVLDTPLPLMGGKGVFTKALDEALLDAEIDLAVHSLKDIPTRLPEGLVIGAVSEREDTADVLVTREAARAYFGGGADSPGDDEEPADASVVPASFPEQSTAWLDDPGYEAVIASSSHRRIGQWLAQYPRHRTTDIRGNVQTRLRKLAESDWNGAVFAAAGLVRLGLHELISIRLDWMLPAPAQGAMAVIIREGDDRIRKEVACVHDPATALCTGIERELLRILEGGCSAPVGALATLAGSTVRLCVNTVYPDGTGLLSFDMSALADEAVGLGRRAADEALRRGADALIRDLGGGVARAAIPRKPLALSTRTVTSPEVALARRSGIRLMDYPVWQYRWVAPPPHLMATIMAEAPKAWVFTSRRGVEGWWRVWKEQMKKQVLRNEMIDRARGTQAGTAYGAKDEPGVPGPHPPSIPRVYAVGETTAQTVRHLFGEVDIRVASTDGEALGRDLVGDGVARVVHFCAVERRPELARLCMANGIALTEAEVYERRPLSAPKPLRTTFEALLFFSPDGVREFLRIYAERIRLMPEGSWKAIAVGQTTAAAFRKQTGREPLTASTPSLEEMLKLV